MLKSYRMYLKGEEIGIGLYAASVGIDDDMFQFFDAEGRITCLVGCDRLERVRLSWYDRETKECLEAIVFESRIHEALKVVVGC